MIFKLIFYGLIILALALGIIWVIGDKSFGVIDECRDNDWQGNYSLLGGEFECSELVINKLYNGEAEDDGS